MKDRFSLVAIIASVVIFIAVVAAVVILQTAHNTSVNKQLSSQLTSLKSEYNDLKSQTDANGYTPTAVVVAFLNDVKIENTTSAKLYLSSTVQDMDIKNTLKLGSDLANINIGDIDQNITGDTAIVKINIQVGTDTVARQFNIIKENDTWKITGVVAS